MKRMKRNPGKFETLDLYRALARQEGYKFSDPESSRSFIQRLESEFTKASNNPITVHGLRAQTMFGYVAASLGRCAIIKSEDSEEIVFDTDNLELPDYRILLSDGQEFLVEVKNFNQKRGFEPFSLKKSYLDGLVNYGSLFRKDLKLAVYWARWNVWTLLSPSALKVKGSNYVLPFEEAIKRNEMRLLGDLSVATTPPLVLRIVTDPAKPRTIEPGGKARFTIAGIELYCNGTQITDSFEKSLAFYFLLYSRWIVSDAVAEIVDEEISAVRYTAKPEESHADQGFEFLGSMSEMISKNFDFLTASEGSVERLSPQSDSLSLGLMIPKGYTGEALPLWTFILEPASEKDHSAWLWEQWDNINGKRYIRAGESLDAYEFRVSEGLECADPNQPAGSQGYELGADVTLA